MAAASAACRRGFGASPGFLRSGGTIPAAGHLRRTLGIPVILLGLALPDDGAHAPNERFHLPNLWQGIDTLVWFLLEAAQLGRLAALPMSRSAGLRAAASTCTGRGPGLSA
jgi:acetylornithine deacetylase/succinyl-diaminopimelate desuccinylase-like protein